MTTELLVDMNTPVKVGDGTGTVVGQVNYGTVFFFSSTATTPAVPSIATDGNFYLTEGKMFRFDKQMKMFAVGRDGDSDSTKPAKISFDIVVSTP